MPPSETDLCATCSAPFDDVKGVIECVSCAKFFHGKCESVDLRGFHSRRSKWKCRSCSSKTDQPPASDGDASGRKRLRGANGDVIEVDRAAFADLVNLVKSLSVSVEELKSQVSVVSKQNSTLIAEIKTLRDKAKVVNESIPVSHVAVTSRSNTLRPLQGLNFSVRKSDSAAPFVFGGHSDVQLYSTAAKAAPAASTKDVDNKGVRRVNPRPFKPPVIGSKTFSPTQPDTDSASSASSQPTLVDTERRQWLYVGRIKPGTTAAMVIDYVKVACNTSDVVCFSLASNDDICSFKVGVRESHIQELLDADKWPKGVAVREFINFRKRPPVPSDVSTKKVTSPSTPTKENFRGQPVDGRKT